MKLFSSYLILFAFALSLVAAESTVVKSQELKISGTKVEDVSLVELNKEPLTISLELSSQPEQVSVALKSSGKEIVFPTVLKNSKYELTLPVSKIPKFFKKQDSIEFELIVGDFNKDLNLITKLFDIKVGEQLQNKTSYKPSLRYGSLPEIHHIFKGQEGFVNPIVPIVFIGVIIVLFLGLLSFWSGLGLKIGNIGSIDILFIATLFLYEFIFVKYYISDSIFVTLARVGGLTPISVFLGSRVLRKLRLRSSVGQKKDL